MTSQQFASIIEQSKAHSYWLKKAIVTAQGRDICDMHADTEALLKYCEMRSVEEGLIKPKRSCWLHIECPDNCMSIRD